MSMVKTCVQFLKFIKQNCWCCVKLKDCKSFCYPRDCQHVYVKCCISKYSRKRIHNFFFISWQSSSDEVKCIEEESEDDQMASQETLQPVRKKTVVNNVYKNLIETRLQDTYYYRIIPMSWTVRFHRRKFPNQK